jgi:hypothetical protein
MYQMLLQSLFVFFSLLLANSSTLSAIRRTHLWLTWYNDNMSFTVPKWWGFIAASLQFAAFFDPMQWQVTASIATIALSVMNLLLF